MQYRVELVGYRDGYEVIDTEAKPLSRVVCFCENRPMAVRIAESLNKEQESADIHH